MTISNFDRCVQIEQVRFIETDHTLACEHQLESTDYPVHSNFEERLWLRAKRLVDCNGLRAAMGRAARLSRVANTIAMILAGTLGAAGATYAFSDDHTINIYWLLMVLLGFNLISMLLWLTGVSLNLDGLVAGVLARLTSWLPDRLKTGSKSGTQANRAWLACHFGGQTGKWRLSIITHQLWLVYLFAGLAILTLILMVRQYDFVWGTTLLSDSAFVKLTDVMSMPLHTLGFATPSVDQVQDTRIGASHILTTEHRNHWAQFLLGALLCYGILPRMLLWLWSMLMSRASLRRFTLDYYLPYYISLRQQLMPLSGHGQIVDADASPPGITHVPSVNLVPQQLSVDTKWVSVELGNDISWPPGSIGIENDLGQVIDRESLARITQQLQRDANPVIAVAVDATRTPDRGVQRTITSLLSGSTQRWLVLLQHHEQESISKARLAAWYRLAEACKVPADHVISMIAS